MPQHVERASAPTRARPAEQASPPSQPGVRTPDEWPDTAEAPWPWWRRTAIVIPLAVVLIVAAVATILVVVSGGNEPAPEPAPRPGGPLDGTFAVAFGVPTMPNGQPYQNAPGGSETWVIKSACRAAECVATASKVSGSQSTTSTLVLDEIDGHWMAVSATQGTCRTLRPNIWESMSYSPAQRNTAGRVHPSVDDAPAARNQQVTLHPHRRRCAQRVGRRPRSTPPRVVSPAEALHGRYQETDTYAEGGGIVEVNFDIQTYCLRTGRALPELLDEPRRRQDSWFSTRTSGCWPNTSMDSKCTSGAPAHREVSLQYALPQPPQDPITLLTGRGHNTLTGDCPFNSDFDSRVERTGTRAGRRRMSQPDQSSRARTDGAWPGCSDHPGRKSGRRRCTGQWSSRRTPG